MKKSLIAVAALAAVGAASAQSSVTLYGVVDAGYGVEQVRNKVTVARVTSTEKVRTTGLISGGSSGPRWGLKGQEDLGNGLSAVFNVEAGFNSTNGAFAGGFNRRSVVGLKGSFGQVLLGRDYTPVDSIAGDYQAVSKVTEDELTKGFNTGRYTGVHYSGEFGGVGVSAFAGYDSKKTTNSTGVVSRARTEGYGIGVSYSGGPVTVGAAVQQFREKNAATTTRKDTEYGVGATYDFTAAKLHAHYLANDARNEKPMQQFGVGVTVPFGAFTLGAQYAYNYWKAPAGIMVAGQATVNNDKIKGHDFALEGTYALSKRTAFYARAARANSWKVKNAGFTAQTHTDSFAVGLRHRF
ncbi:MAG: porin [Brachymonas sp.]|nr:porin [Brachymonas sp.]